jgi:hypothetical protein
MSYLHLPCRAHAMLWPWRSSQGHGTAEPSRDSLWATCTRSASSVYHTEFHEGHDTVGAGQGNGMGTAWARHTMCESAFIGMSITNHQNALHKILEELRSHLHCSRSVKTCMNHLNFNGLQTFIAAFNFSVCIHGWWWHFLIFWENWEFPSSICSSQSVHFDVVPLSRLLARFRSEVLKITITLEPSIMAIFIIHGHKPLTYSMLWLVDMWPIDKQLCFEVSCCGQFYHFCLKGGCASDGWEVKGSLPKPFCADWVL